MTTRSGGLLHHYAALNPDIAQEWEHFVIANPLRPH
jgi:hypothetical protein